MPQKPTYPLDLNTLFSLKKGSFILVGVTTLASGAAIIEDRRIKPSSFAFLTYGSTSSPGILSSSASSGELDITSSDGSDASDVNYLILL